MLSCELTQGFPLQKHVVLHYANVDGGSFSIRLRSTLKILILELYLFPTLRQTILAPLTEITSPPLQSYIPNYHTSCPSFAYIRTSISRVRAVKSPWSVLSIIFSTSSLHSHEAIRFFFYLPSSPIKLAIYSHNRCGNVVFTPCPHFYSIRFCCYHLSATGLF